MPKFKPQRQQLYTQLRQEHLTYREALEYSRMSKHRPPGASERAKAVYPPALRKIVQERRVMWQAFDRTAKGKGWGNWRRNQEWKGKVGKLYERLSRNHTGNFFVSKNVHGKEVPRRLNPWALYDAIYDNLPEDDQWDTPRSTRRSGQTGVSFKVERRYKEKALRTDIRYLKDEIRRTGDPSGILESRLLGLQYNLKTGSF